MISIWVQICISLVLTSCTHGVATLSNSGMGTRTLLIVSTKLYGLNIWVRQYSTLWPGHPVTLITYLSKFDHSTKSFLLVFCGQACFVNNEAVRLFSNIKSIFLNVNHLLEKYSQNWPTFKLINFQISRHFLINPEWPNLLSWRTYLLLLSL